MAEQTRVDISWDSGILQEWAERTRVLMGNAEVEHNVSYIEVVWPANDPIQYDRELLMSFIYSIQSWNFTDYTNLKMSLVRDPDQKLHLRLHTQEEVVF